MSYYSEANNQGDLLGNMEKVIDLARLVREGLSKDRSFEETEITPYTPGAQRKESMSG